MKTIGLQKATLNRCVKDAQQERLIITRNGKPVALIIGVEGMDEEQVRLGSSSKFWTLIAKRRAQRTLSRAEMGKKIPRSRAQ
jgi:antitoxin (DNA-binding transcriptional repressor) of toxin-antitoxin stability system